MNNFENEKPAKSEFYEKALEKKIDEQGNTPSENKEGTKVISAKITEKFGKFSSSEQLLTAYNNLEKEFTRKSQKLKEFESVSTLCDNEGSSPQKDSNQQVENFVMQNPQAEKIVEENAKQIVDNPNVGQVVSAQSSHLNDMSGKYLDPSELVKDRSFVENFVLNNPELKQLVMQDLVNTLSKSELPQTINGMNGAISLTPPFRPKSIREASKMAENYFNK